jgi:hypothetical protein
MAVWKKQEEERKERNKRKQQQYHAAVAAWEATRAERKAAGCPFRELKPKRTKNEGPTPKPPLTAILEESSNDSDDADGTDSGSE